MKRDPGPKRPRRLDGPVLSHRNKRGFWKRSERNEASDEHG